MKLARRAHPLAPALAFTGIVMWFDEREIGDHGGGRWKLIDLDGLLTAGERIDASHAEFYTARYAPPELAAAVVNADSIDWTAGTREATNAFRLFRVSRKLDVWSLGLVLIEMLTLRPLLQSQLEHCCETFIDDADDTDALGRGPLEFLRWLGEPSVPLPLPTELTDISHSVETRKLHDSNDFTRATMSTQTSALEAETMLLCLLHSLLVDQILHKNPTDRSSVPELLCHPFLTSHIAQSGDRPNSTPLGDPDRDNGAPVAQPPLSRAGDPLEASAATAAAPTSSPANKAKTAFQLYRDDHMDLILSEGFKRGAQALREASRRWKETCAMKGDVWEAYEARATRDAST